MHVYKHPLWTFFLISLSGLILVGCATRVSDSITVPVGELAMYEAIPKETSITRLGNHISDAKSDNMPLLAPHYFREASDMLDKIKRLSPDDVSTDDLAKADAILDKGEAVSRVVQNTLSRELKLKVELDELSANEIYPWRYKALINELSRLIEKIELGNSGNIDQDKEELNKAMQELHAKTVQYTSSQKKEPLR